MPGDLKLKQSKLDFEKISLTQEKSGQNDGNSDEKSDLFSCSVVGEGQILDFEEGAKNDHFVKNGHFTETWKEENVKIGPLSDQFLLKRGENAALDSEEGPTEVGNQVGKIVNPPEIDLNLGLDLTRKPKIVSETPTPVTSATPMNLKNLKTELKLSGIECLSDIYKSGQTNEQTNRDIDVVTRVKRDPKTDGTDTDKKVTENGDRQTEVATVFRPECPTESVKKIGQKTFSMKRVPSLRMKTLIEHFGQKNSPKKLTNIDSNLKGKISLNVNSENKLENILSEAKLNDITVRSQCHLDSASKSIDEPAVNKLIKRLNNSKLSERKSPNMSSSKSKRSNKKPNTPKKSVSQSEICRMYDKLKLKRQSKTEDTNTNMIKNDKIVLENDTFDDKKLMKFDKNGKLVPLKTFNTDIIENHNSKPALEMPQIKPLESSDNDQISKSSRPNIKSKI